MINTQIDINATHLDKPLKHIKALYGKLQKKEQKEQLFLLFCKINFSYFLHTIFCNIIGII